MHIRHNGKLSEMTAISLNSSHNIILIRDSIEFWVAKNIYLFTIFLLGAGGGGYET